LNEIGDWLKTNGEGIYDTVPWKTFGEGKVNTKDGSFKDNKTKKYTENDVIVPSGFGPTFKSITPFLLTISIKSHITWYADLNLLFSTVPQNGELKLR